MAIQLGTKGPTRAVDFHDHEGGEATSPSKLFRINAGFTASDLAFMATCFEDSVQKRLSASVDGGMDGSEAWMLAFVMEVANACRQASQTEG